MRPRQASCCCARCIYSSAGIAIYYTILAVCMRSAKRAPRKKSWKGWWLPLNARVPLLLYTQHGAIRECDINRQFAKRNKSLKAESQSQKPTIENNVNCRVVYIPRKRLSSPIKDLCVYICVSVCVCVAYAIYTVLAVLASFSNSYHLPAAAITIRLSINGKQGKRANNGAKR